MTYKSAFRALSLLAAAALTLCSGCADIPVSGGSADPDSGVNAYLGVFNPALRLQVSPLSGGGVSADPPPNSEGTYRYGETVTVKAVPSRGYVFKEWSGASTSSVDLVNIVMDGSKTLTAVFEH